MLIVQRITTDWTKASRGGDAASIRNSVPEAFALPTIPDCDCDYIFHEIHARENEGFTCRDTLIESRLSGHLHIGPFFIHIAHDHISTRFVWSWHECGAPERPSQTLFKLNEGQWGQFKCNGRFGAQSTTGREWGYRKSVFNVAFLRSFNSEVFVNSDPTTREARLAALR